MVGGCQEAGGRERTSALIPGGDADGSSELEALGLRSTEQRWRTHPEMLFTAPGAATFNLLRKPNLTLLVPVLRVVASPPRIAVRPDLVRPYW